MAASEELFTPVVSDGLVLIHTSNGMLQALNAFDGAIKWTVNLDVPPLTLRGRSTLTTAFGIAFVGSNNGRISAIMINKGQIIWQQCISKFSGATGITVSTMYKQHLL